MRKCCLALCLLLSGILAESANAAEKVTKGWHKNYSKAYFEAKRLGLPLVVHFYTDWCGPCQQMEASVLNTAEGTAKTGKRLGSTAGQNSRWIEEETGLE